MIMCLRCSNDLVTLHETEIAFHLRITDAELAETKALFIGKGFIDEHWNLMNWEKRQFKSDSSAARVSKHRERKKAQSNGDVTLQKRRCNALDTDTDKKEETPLPPLGLDPQAWDRWSSYRKKIRRPLKQASITAAQKSLAAFGDDQLAVVEQSIANGWQGLFDLKKGGRNETRKPSLAERATNARKEFERRIAEREANGEFVGEDESHLRPQVVVKHG